jgi:hypothetical protein
MPDTQGAPTVADLVGYLNQLRPDAPVYLDDDAFASSSATGDYVSLTFALGEMGSAEEDATTAIKREKRHEIVVVSPLSAEQLAELLGMCGLPAERLKPWANDREPTESGRFRLDVPDAALAGVVAFAQEAGLKFRTETMLTTAYHPAVPL